MVTMANLSDKSIYPQEGLKKQKNLSFPFSFASLHKVDYNLIIFGCTTKWFAPSCSSRDSAPGDILVIDILKMAAHMAKTEVGFSI